MANSRTPAPVLGNTLHPDNIPLSRWAYVLLALLAAAIGLASSVVTTKFFIIGLERTEPDSLAREALILAGVLMIVCELAAFGLAAMLPKALLKALRWRLMACGLALLAFEAATIYVTQVTLVKSSESAAGSVGTRIADLRASIDARRAAAAGLQAAGQHQTQSHRQSAGAASYRQSLDAVRQTEPMAAELARLEAGKVPTLTDVLGETGMLVYAVSRALLISIMGLVMFGAAGAMLRAARAGSLAGGAGAGDAAAGVPAGAAVAGSGAGFKPTATVMPKGALPYPSKALAMGAVPFAALGGATMAHAAPAVPAAPAALTQAHLSKPAALTQAHLSGAGEPAQAHTVTAKSAPKAPAKAKKVRSTSAVADGQKRDTGTQGKAAGRYERIKSAVAAGKVKPSIRALQAEEGGGSLVARRYLHQLEADGVTVRSGKGWKAAAPVAGKKGGAS